MRQLSAFRYRWVWADIGWPAYAEGTDVLPVLRQEPHSGGGSGGGASGTRASIAAEMR